MRVTIVKQGQLHNEQTLFAYAGLPTNHGSCRPSFAIQSLQAYGQMASNDIDMTTYPLSEERLLRDLLPHSALLRKRRC